MRSSIKKLIQISCYTPEIEYDFDAERSAISSILAGELLHEDNAQSPTSFDLQTCVRLSASLHPLRIADGAFIEQEVQPVKITHVSPKDEYRKKEDAAKTDVDKMKYISDSIKDALKAGMRLDVIRIHMQWLDEQTFNNAIKDMT